MFIERVEPSLGFVEAEGDIEGYAVVIFAMLVGEADVPGGLPGGHEVDFVFGVVGFGGAVPAVAHLDLEGPVWEEAIESFE